MKTLAQIHQQALDLISRTSLRRHADTSQFDRIVAIHNRYIRNICSIFGAADASRLTRGQWNTPLSRPAYTTTINPQP